MLDNFIYVGKYTRALYLKHATFQSRQSASDKWKMTTYIYEPLDYDKAQIRVVHLPPALDESEPIRISLHKVTIPRSCLGTSLESNLEAIDLASEESDVKKPDFIALSYVWGSPDDPQGVIIEPAPEGANTISITRNLDVALRNMRLKSKVVVVWIDAICIDQGNLEERSHQVAFMDRIYTIARGTLVWLGPEEDDSHHAMELLGYVGERVEYIQDFSVKRHLDAPPRKPNEPILESLTEELPYGEKDLCILITFFERPWFTRLWIRQEIALAKEAQILCGRTRMYWVDFQNAAGWFFSKPWPKAAPVHLRERLLKIKPAMKNVFEVNLNFLSYETLRRDIEGVKFTDPRDLIYGVKSLLDTNDQELDVRPNYTLQTADVFMDVYVRIVERQRLTYFLESCELASISVPNLPSWVPDWSKPMKAGGNLKSTWSACGFISPNATYLGDGVLGYLGDGVLRVAGIRIDKIESVRDMWDPVDNEVLKRGEIAFDYIWSCYPGDSLVDSPYDEKQSMTDAYCRTLSGGVFREDWDAPDYKHQTFDDAKEALKKIWSVEEDYTGHEDVRTDPLAQTFLKTCGFWTFGRCFFTTESGYIGLAPVGTEPGDIITVILGCRFPVILRQDPTTKGKPDKTRWKVVGVCYTHGVMCGEAIYGSLSIHYCPVHRPQVTKDELISDEKYALLDSRTNDLKTDPAALLEEAGIQPIAWSRKPHRLEVSVTALREAGVDLHAIYLV